MHLHTADQFKFLHLDLAASELLSEWLLLTSVPEQTSIIPILFSWITVTISSLPIGFVPSTTWNPTNLRTRWLKTDCQLATDGPASCLNRRNPTNLTTHTTLMITRLSMPLLNVNMPCPLLFWLEFIGLFHCRASRPAHYTFQFHHLHMRWHHLVSIMFLETISLSSSLNATVYLHCIHILPYLCLYIIHWSYFIAPRNPLLLSVPDVLDAQFS
jgi:hypothetical protein